MLKKCTSSIFSILTHCVEGGKKRGEETEKEFEVAVAKNIT